MRYAKDNSYPIEIGLYGKSQLVRDFCNKSKKDIKFNIHLNHIEYTLSQIQEYKTQFLQEIKISKEFDATYGVHHMAKYPMSGQKGYWKELIDEVTKRMIEVENICKEVDFDIYIENTFESVAFYRTIFEKLKEHQTKKLHFCFDIGHAKVWSGDNFDTWFSFLKDLKEIGFKLHFHLHANYGLIDQHLSPLEIKTEDGKDDVFSNQTYKEMFQNIIDTFPNECKIFEVKPDLAIKTIKWIEKNL